MCAVRIVALAAVLGASAVLSGCGMQAAPQPPSLKLPEPVKDLRAARTGDEVALTWTMPQRDTSKVLLKEAVTARVCRREAAAGSCSKVADVLFAPGAQAAFKEDLPAAMATGQPRPLSYFVELINQRGRSAGLSNASTVLAGKAPVPPAGLVAEVRKQGVVLHWIPGPAEPYATEIRLERTLLTPAPKKQAQGPLTAPPEPLKQNLLVPAGEVRGRAIDKDIRFGNTYEYRAQRITRVTANGKTLELDSSFSPPVKVEALDVFPPAMPTGLAAVATPAENGAGPAIDLSWQPDAEADVAGYAVYRRETGQPESAWQRISAAQPVVGAGFHDPKVQPGRTYEYAVTALGQNGKESARSESAQETTPEP